jgi:D-alanine transaminase
VYEVIPVYDGRLFRLEQHLERLDRSLAAIQLTCPYARSHWVKLLKELVGRNGEGDQSIYVQVTRGVAVRTHAFPDSVKPTVFAMSLPRKRTATHRGVRVITREDTRWSRCDIKAITLLPNTLMRQEAAGEGCAEAILLRDGQLTEGAASNVIIVIDGAVNTPPKSHYILPGITRDVVLELAREADLPCTETPVSEAELRTAQEIWLTSSTMEITPVIEMDGVAVSGGVPGPVWAKVWSKFRACTGSLQSIGSM